MILCLLFFFQAEDGIRDLVRSRGLGDVYKRQAQVQKDPCSEFDYSSPRDSCGLLGALPAPAGYQLSLIHI